MHDAAFSMRNPVELSANMHLLYKLFARHNFKMFSSKSQFVDIVTVLFVVSMIVKCEHSALYCATQGHGIVV